MTAIGTRDPAEMDHTDLREEWSEVYHQLRRRTDLAREEENKLWERRRDLWQEMESRADAEPPECPECEHQSWSQLEGEPKTCDGCDLHLDERHEDLIAAIDDYWRAVKGGGESKRGLYDKYEVRKDGEAVEDCFVLEPESDPAAREALIRYAEATDNEELATDLREWVTDLCTRGESDAE